MQRVYESGASAVPPTPPAIPSIGYPSRGNPAAGAMPTVPGPYMMHQLVEELMAVITAGGIAPDPLTLNQLKLALDATYLAKNGTSPILQNFAGLTRSVTPLGGGLLREYVDIANAATVGGLEIGNVYNCAVDAMTGVWAGRDIADICWLEKWHDAAGTKEFWYAATAAAGAVPVWTKIFAIDMVNGALSGSAVFDQSTTSDLVTAVTAGTANALYTPNFTKPKGTYLVIPYNFGFSFANVSGSYFINLFGELISGTGDSGSTNILQTGALPYQQAPFILRVSSTSATFRLGIKNVGSIPVGQGTVTLNGTSQGIYFNVIRIA